MRLFLIRRILSGIAVLWAVSLAAFLLFFARPAGSVARSLAGKEPSAAALQLQAARAERACRWAFCPRRGPAACSTG
jgi:ABC-type dipeptide/oligopeptide/nickel transport system permease component